ncbi:hypothetical protein [Streptomyces sp. enrichment culture]|uniref:hypothetical protein n=1 Tax=Streptomyces sp. enrichment culture TaxID=1795815 RepID=UPI003F577EAB
MPHRVQVRCPVCRREHLYAAPVHPCACGAPVAPPLDPGGHAVPVTRRAWDEEWVTLRCTACGRRSPWPRPELGCPCGTTLMIPLAPRPAPAPPADSASPAALASPAAPVSRPGTAPPPARRRPAFRPVAIRTARDAVTAAALYLRWLGHRDVRRADQRPPSGIALAARGILAQVDPALRPATLRDVECLWLTAMTESARCVYFSLAGYAEDARTRAGTLGVALFVLDLTGTPQPVNEHADALADSPRT